MTNIVLAIPVKKLTIKPRATSVFVSNVFLSIGWVVGQFYDLSRSAGLLLIANYGFRVRVGKTVNVCVDFD